RDRSTGDSSQAGEAMARRPHPQLLTDYDHRDAPPRAEPRAPAPVAARQSPPSPIESTSPQAHLRSWRLWREGEAEHTLTPAAQEILGHAVTLTRGVNRSEPRWDWSVPSIMCAGTSRSLGDARVA